MDEQKAKTYPCSAWTRGATDAIGIMAAILASLHMETADDLFGTPQGSPRTDKLIAASIQWAKKNMEKIDRDGGRNKRGGRCAFLRPRHFSPRLRKSSNPCRSYEVPPMAPIRPFNVLNISTKSL